MAASLAPSKPPAAANPSSRAVAPPPAAEDDPRQLMAQLDLVQREMGRIERRLQALEEAAIETQQAMATLRALSEAETEQDALVPVGGGVHIRARIDPMAKVMLPVGAGYATESDASKVIAALEERAAAVSKQFQATAQEAERLAQASAMLNDRLSDFAPQ